MKKYERVTPIGYFTGKVMIGGFYIPKARPMTDNECVIQSLVLGKTLPIEMRWKSLFSKIRSIFRFKD